MLKLCTITVMAMVELKAIIQSYQIISGSPKMVNLFGRWHMETAGMGYFGSLIAVCVVFILFPETYLIGNLILALTSLWIIYMQIIIKNLKAAMLQSLFLLLNFLLIRLKYPFNCK
jgi:hypothetical protein